jgi:phosphate transport system protein
MISVRVCLLLQQPVASDLRFIISAMQMKEIERIGDLSST